MELEASIVATNILAINKTSFDAVKIEFAERKISN